MKRVLLLTYHYPPSSAVGAVRPSRLAKYLPEFGWAVTVVTATMGEHAESDGAQVHRVAERWHPLKWYERVWRKHAEQQGREEAVAAKWHVPLQALRARPRGIKGLILPFLRLPDQEMGWLVPAVISSARLIIRKRIEAVITTGPPFTVHLVGLILKRLTNIYWLADFRDPWLLSHKVLLHRNRGSDWLESKLIRQVMKLADRIVSVTPEMTEQTYKAFPAIPETKFATVTNGFDPEEFSDITWTRPPADPVHFSYLGSFYYGRSPEPFLRAVGSLLTEGRIGRSDLRITLVGHVQYAEGRPVAEMIQQFGLEDLVELLPAVPRQEALRRTLETHVLLVLDEQHPVQVPYKVYEGLAAGVLLFNIGSEGAVADLVAKTGRGIAVSHVDQEAIKRGILECLKLARRHKTDVGEPWRHPAVAGFHFREIASTFTKHLNAAREERRGH